MIIHIPHSNIRIPDLSGYINPEIIVREMQILTDWYTDEIFYAEAAKRIITPWSRIFCDVERFVNDVEEPMAMLGRGAIYTKTHDGDEMRKLNLDQMKKIITNYYNKHHSKLLKLVTRELKYNNEVLILDAHSFPVIESLPELAGEITFPDFCLGTDAFHTPIDLTMKIYHFLEAWGFSVAIDKPYSGTMVPQEFYHTESRVKSIMIEVNQSLYIEQDNTFPPKKTERFQLVQETMTELINSLCKS